MAYFHGLASVTVAAWVKHDNGECKDVVVDVVVCVDDAKEPQSASEPLLLRWITTMSMIPLHSITRIVPHRDFGWDGWEWNS